MTASVSQFQSSMLLDRRGFNHATCAQPTCPPKHHRATALQARRASSRVHRRPVVHRPAKPPTNPQASGCPQARRDPPEVHHRPLRAHAPVHPQARHDPPSPRKSPAPRRAGHIGSSQWGGGRWPCGGVQRHCPEPHKGTSFGKTARGETSPRIGVQGSIVIGRTGDVVSPGCRTGDGPGDVKNPPGDTAQA